MSTQRKDIEDRALQLPPAERELLAETLWQSLDEEPLSDVDEAWIREAEARYQELHQGKVKGIPGDGVVADIRRELGWRS